VFTMEFKHYDRVSDAYMKKILGRLNGWDLNWLNPVKTGWN
jgi:hypothetical protein